MAKSNRVARLTLGAIVVAIVLLIGLASAPELALVFVAVHGLATMAQNVVYPTVIAWCFGTKHMAEIYGVMMLALLPGGIVGPVALGYIHDALGSYEVAFRVLLGLTIVSLAMLAAVRPLRVRNGADAPN